MAEFAALATRYVLADSEEEQRQLAQTAAQDIQNAARKSSAVLGWAQSINQWMPGRSSSGGGDDDMDGDVITRAKGFLSATLEELDKDVLRSEQVEHLIAFFGVMFAIDHKAGILAAATALRCLCAMAHFRPSMAAAVLGHVVKLDEDFRLQVPATRRAVYGLVGRLVDDEAVLRALHDAYGAPCSFLVDLLQMCRHERDPDNLMSWFAILQTVLVRYGNGGDGGGGSDTDGEAGLSADAVLEVFKAVSDYFPISMRSATTASGTTVEQLKAELRACFAACWLAATAVFDFLLLKLDQGDALTVSVKVDIFKTMQACVASFERPAQSLAPHASRLWNSLKYEVRHGEVPENMDATLQVIHAVSARLDGMPTAPPLNDFVDAVLADCLSDLAKPTYAKQAGQLLDSVLGGGLRSFHLAIVPVLAAVKQNLNLNVNQIQGQQPSLHTTTQTPAYTRDLVTFLNDVLQTRNVLSSRSDDDSAVAVSFHSHDDAICALLDAVYLRLWRQGEADHASAAAAVRPDILKGLARLVAQNGRRREATPASTGTPPTLLLSQDQVDGVVHLLIPCIRPPLLLQPLATPAADDENTNSEDVAHHAMLTIQAAVAGYSSCFVDLTENIVAWVRRANLASLSLSSTELDGVAARLRDTMTRVAFIGCAALAPLDVVSENSSSSSSSVLFSFLQLERVFVSLVEYLLEERVPFALINAALSGVYAGVLHQRDAFARHGAVAATTKKTAPQATLPEPLSSGQSAFLAEKYVAFLRASQSIVRNLYRRATAVSPGGSLHLSADFEIPTSSTAAPPDGPASALIEDQDRYLHQLASLATTVVRDQGVDEQKGLHSAAVGLFWEVSAGRDVGRTVLPRAALFQQGGGRVDVLSLGILRGLWPSTVACLSDMSITPRSLLDDFDLLDSLPPRTRVVRNGIAMVVANKYSASAKSVAGNEAAWQATVDAVRERLSAPSPMTPHQFARLVAIAAGALACLDKHAKPLATLLAFAPAQQVEAAIAAPVVVSAEPARKGAVGIHRAAEQMARSLGQLVSSNGNPRAPVATSSSSLSLPLSSVDAVLSPDDHAVVKSIHKQWVYSQTVKMLLPLAFPPRKPTTTTSEAMEGVDVVARDEITRRASTVHTIAVLSLVRRMPYSVYEDDVEALVRILVAAVAAATAATASQTPAALEKTAAAMTTTTTSTATMQLAWADVGVALRVLSTVLEHRPAAVQGHLKTLVDGSIAVFGRRGRAGAQQRSGSGSGGRGPPPACRSQALCLVGSLPAHLDDAALRPYEPRLSRALAAACGDPAREIRSVAQRAREGWAKLAD